MVRIVENTVESRFSSPTPSSNVIKREVLEPTVAFTIDSIERKEEASTLMLEWNGNAIHADKKGKKEIEIPALGDFKFLNGKVFHGEEQFIQLSFSDPIKVDQDLRGLVQIQGIANIDFVVEENSIKVFPTSR